MKNKMTVKRIAALFAVVLLAALYLIALIAAIFDTTAAGILFRICLICTVTVPLLAWIFIWIYGQTTGKSTIADVHLFEAPEDYGKEKLQKEDEIGDADGETVFHAAEDEIN